MFTLLTGSLFTLSFLVAALFFYFTYSVLMLIQLPGERYEKKILTEQYQKLVRYEAIHTALVLLYLAGLVACVLVSLESVKSMKLTLAEVSISMVIVLYIVMYMRGLLTQKRLSLERLLRKRSAAIFEESFKRLEVDYFKGKRQETLRETFSEFEVFPFDQLLFFANGLVDEDGEREILIHAWIIEKTKFVNEYKQFYRDSSYMREGLKRDVEEK